VVSGHRLNFPGFFRFLIFFFGGGGWWLDGWLFFGFIYLVIHLFLFYYFLLYKKVILRGHFSTIHKEKNGSKAINSIQEGIIFLLRILTRVQIST
jgi:hypothetical protein